MLHWRFVFVIIPAILVFLFAVDLVFHKYKKKDIFWTVYLLLSIDLLYVIAINIAAFSTTSLKLLRDGTLGIIGNMFIMLCLTMVLFNERRH